MRCVACDCRLSNREATRRFDSGEFCDLCDECLEITQDAYSHCGLDAHETEVIEEDDDDEQERS